MKLNDTILFNALNSFSKPIIVINNFGIVFFRNTFFKDKLFSIKVGDNLQNYISEINSELLKSIFDKKRVYIHVKSEPFCSQYNINKLGFNYLGRNNGDELFQVEFNTKSDFDPINQLNLSNSILYYANKSTTIKDLLTNIVIIIKDYSKCKAVGVRLLDEAGNIPYEYYNGFPKSFYESESPLCIHTDHCMCINVIQGDIDKAQPYYTAMGSFYMNTTSKFLAAVPEEKKGATRNICNDYGYESVALIPIVLNEKILGLIHMADSGEYKVPLELVESLEYVAMHLGESISRIWDHDKVIAEHKNLKLDLKQEHSELVSSERRFKQLYNLNPIPSYIWEYNEHHFILKDYNQAGSDITKGRIVDYLGKTELDIHGEEPEILQAFHKCVAEKSRIQIEIKRIMKSTKETKYFVSYFIFIEPNMILVLSEDVTSFKLLEMELRQSQKYLHSIIDAMPDIVLTIDKNGTFLDVHLPLNSQYISQKDRYIHKNIKDLGFPDSIVSDGLDRIRQALEFQQIQTQMFSYSSESNDWFFESRVIPIDTQLVIAIVRDITESHNLTMELQKSQKSLEEAEKVAHIGHYELNFNTGDVIWSKETFRIFEMDPETCHEPTLEEYNKLVHPEDLPILMDKITETIEQLIQFDFVYRIKPDKSQIKYVHSIGNMVINELGHSVMFGTFQDVTQQKRVENNLREREEHYRVLIESSPNSVLVVQDGKYVYGNSSGAEMLGYTSTELDGLDVMKTIAPEYHDLIINRMKQTNKSNKPIEIELVRKDGTSIISESTSVLITLNQKKAFLVIGKDISERKQYMNKLIYERDRLFSVFQGLPVYIYLQKQDYSIDFANQEFINIFGDVTNKKCYQVFYDCETPCKECPTFNVFETRQAKVREWKRDEKYYLLMDSFMPATEISEAMVMEIGIDITKRKETELKLKQSEKRYRNLYSKTPVMLHSINDKGEIVEVSDFWLQKMGYKQNDVIGNKSINFLTSESRKQALEVYLPKFYQTGMIRNSNYKFVKKNGQIIDILMSVTSEKDENGNVIKSYAVSIDVTEQLKAERLLKESEEKFRTFSEQSLLGVVIIQDFNIKYANKKYFDLLAIEQVSIETLDFDQLVAKYIHPEDIHIIKSSSMVLNPDLKFPFTKTIRIIDGNKQLKWFQIFVTDIIFQGTKATMVNLVDITEMVNIRQALEDSQREIRNMYLNLQQVREEERAKISREIHDELGQTLTALKIDTHFFKKYKYLGDYELDIKIKSMLELIDRSLSTVKQIATDLRPGVLDHLGLVSALEWQINDFQKRMNINCDVQFKINEIEIAPQKMIAVFRIFQETLTNISRHAQAQNVKIVLEKVDSFLILTICDDGIGITDEMLKNPFSFGIKGIKERLLPFNGIFDITGHPDKGTCIKIQIPIDDK